MAIGYRLRGRKEEARPRGERVRSSVMVESSHVMWIEIALAFGTAWLCGAAWSGSAVEILVNHADDNRALADGRRHPFHRPVPDVSDREHPGHTRFEREWGTSQGPRRTPSVAVQEVLARDDVPCLVARDLGRQPLGVGPGADMDKERGGRNRLGAPRGSIVEDEAFEPAVSATVDDLGVQSDVDVLRGLDVFHEVVRHVRSECPPADEE